MNIAVIGLGIIGGSFCKAIKKYTDNFVIGINRTQATAEKALEAGAIDKIGTPESLGEYYNFGTLSAGCGRFHRKIRQLYKKRRYCNRQFGN